MFSYSQAKTIIIVAFVFASYAAIAFEDVFEESDFQKVSELDKTQEIHPIALEEALQETEIPLTVNSENTELAQSDESAIAPDAEESVLAQSEDNAIAPKAEEPLLAQSEDNAIAPDAEEPVLAQSEDNAIAPEAEEPVLAQSDESAISHDAAETVLAKSKEALPVPELLPPVMTDPVPTASVSKETTETQQASTVITNNTGIDTQNCPNDFYQVQVPEDGKLCQVFAAELPASMIFFVPKTPKEVLSFYQNNNSGFDAIKEVKGRFLMQNQEKSKTLIISEDGQGTQVDILIKS